MKNFPSNIKFKYTWRKYQQKVLDELDIHIKDRHLHIIAPPGSGKTVLGLEVAIRINKPTLILAPTLTIRNQWIERLCELFLESRNVPEWISTDIRKPSFLTVVTYQGLHAACNDEKKIYEETDSKEYFENNKPSNNRKFKDILAKLKSQDVGTIVVDEAHHLRNEWWHTLIKVKSHLKPFIVGLTATPPYDVGYNEWKRYLEVNGPIDCEISVPELIAEGDLCPHQDFVYFSRPTEKEYENIKNFRTGADELFQSLSRSELLIKAIISTQVWKEPENHLEWIYDNITTYTSILFFLKANLINIPEIHPQILGIDEKEEYPELSYENLEIILNFFLFQGKDHFPLLNDEQEKLHNKLQRHGVIERNKVNLTYNSRLNKVLISSKSKFNSILNIVNFEYKSLNKSLRMVILSDYIHADNLARNNTNTQDYSKIGVIPIFEHLRTHNYDNKKLGVLTGSLAIIPQSTLSNFKQLCSINLIEDINSVIEIYHEYVIISPNNLLRNKMVRIITKLFQDGDVEVLIGTKSLLGEGWDAPAINSLILASFVGSFVLSNQMRGRAIRSLKTNPLKTSNIWHLVCIDPSLPNGGNDLEIMTRRFRTFVGISNNEDTIIENGVQRLEIHQEDYSLEIINNINTQMFDYASKRTTLDERWNNAINKGVHISEEIKIPIGQKNIADFSKKKSLYYKKTIAYLIAELITAFMLFTADAIELFLRNLRGIRSIKDILYYLSYILVMGLCVLGWKTFKTAKLYLQYRDISKDIKKIGEALLLSLAKEGTIKTSLNKLSVVAYTMQDGAIYCYLDGATTFEQSTFIDALQEIIDTIDNPRYLIIRKKDSLLSKKKDYHSVPEILGRNQVLAKYFSEQWSQLVGSCQLVYTRTIEGRKQLLQARVKSLSSRFANAKPSEQINKWR